MISFIENIKPLIYKDEKRIRYIKKAKFKCECGNIFITRLRKQLPISCGCIVKKGLHKTHNLSKTSNLYNTWISIKSRCFNLKNKCYYLYGGRGITMQENWVNNFKAFYLYIGEKPKGKSIDRIDVNGNYEEGNIKWSSDVEQANNRRNNKKLTFMNKILTYSEWEKQLGIHQSVIRSRILAGWSVEKTLTTPVKKHKQLIIKAVEKDKDLNNN